MDMKTNHLKAALAAGEMQLGLWLNAASPVAAEIAGHAGFDWCLIDGEHSPWDPGAILGQLRALEATGTEAVLRLPIGETWVVKQALDMGVRTLLVPMVDTAHHAEALVRACRYPPHGVRGMAPAVVRASGFGAVAGYATEADDQICLMVQVETRKALENLDEIAAVEGVDVVFLGPSDLSADMGYPGNPRAPEVVAALEDAIGRIRAAGKAAGIIHYDRGQFAHYAGLGVRFLGVGADVSLMRAAFGEVLEAARKAV